MTWKRLFSRFSTPRSRPPVWNENLESRLENITAQVRTEVLAELREKTEGIGEQLAKLARFQYKFKQEQLGLVQALADGLDRLERNQLAESAREEERAETLRALVKRLVKWLDDLDGFGLYLGQGGEPEAAAWRSLLEQWREQVREALLLAGLQEIPVLGRVFDPGLMEAIGTVPMDALDPPARVPYLVVRVVRRGYARAGRLYRKAQVITVLAEGAAAAPGEAGGESPPPEPAAATAEPGLESPAETATEPAPVPEPVSPIGENATTEEEASGDD